MLLATDADYPCRPRLTIATDRHPHGAAPPGAVVMSPAVPRSANTTIRPGRPG